MRHRRRRQILGSTAAFDPLSLSPAAVWDDLSPLFTTGAGSTPAVSDGDPVGRWADRSGNGRHLTSPADVNRATLKLAVKNGRNAVLFDGVDDMLFNVGTFAQGHWYFVAVYTPATFDTFDGLYTSDAASANTRILIGSAGANWFQGGGGPIATGAVYTRDGVSVNHGTAWPAPVNGVWSSFSVKGATSPTFSAQLGQDGGNAGRQWTGYIASAIVFPTQLSAANDLKMQVYNKNKWATP
jgi:hypothetical protein